MNRSTVSLAALLLATACSQPAALVEFRGAEFFGQERSLHASQTDNPAPIVMAQNNAPVSQSTEQMASVGSVEVNDIGAPAAQAQQAPASMPFARAATPAPKTFGEQPKQFGEVQLKPAPAMQEQTIAVQEAAPAAQPMQTAQAGKPNINPWSKNKRDIASDAFKDDHVSNARLLSDVPQEGARDYIWPTSSHKVLSAYGPKGGGMVNDGINIAAANGEPVWSAADGEVVYVGNELKGYGNMVLVKHTGGKTSTYAHLGRTSVDKYQRVKQGDVLGYVGKTGNVKDPQLHFAVRQGKDPVDPQKLISQNVAGL